ncbi:MAG: DUF4956 domain-containing protein [Deltaproteobacteria bacterium]|nr:DUF4956 domain-containing protein [Deltaproteobacteria bacterium]
MVDFFDLFNTGLGPVSWEQAALCLLLAFVLGKVVAVTYERTHFGLSFSRSFAQALVLAAVVASMLMLAIGDNLARGLGILGTVALVRFRTNVPDSRDMIFMFAALAVGIAAGVRSYPVALVGALGFAGAAHALNWEPLKVRQRFDGMLRFWLARDAVSWAGVQAALDTHCDTAVLVAMRDLAQGDTIEYAYQLKLRRGATQDQLFHALAAVPGTGGITFMIEDAHGEI